MLVTKQTLQEKLDMFSTSLDLPEFDVVKQNTFPTHYIIHVEKKADEEHCALWYSLFFVLIHPHLFHVASD